MQGGATLRARRAVALRGLEDVFRNNLMAWAVSGSLLVTLTGAAPPSASGVRATSNRAPLSAAAVARNAAMTLLRSRVKYVFVLYQENRSFDSYFGTFPGADGIYSQTPAQTPGFYQPVLNTDGVTYSTVTPFRIGPAQYAADTDDVNHSHPVLIQKIDVNGGYPRMDRFALAEQAAQSGQGPLVSKQLGELTMAYEDCDTIPLLWNYANRFVLYDHIFQSAIGPSTPGNLTVIAAQSGETQFGLHPSEAYTGNGGSGPGVPVVNDANPAWGPGAGTQLNQTYATIPFSLAGNTLATIRSSDPMAALDFADLGADQAHLSSAPSYGWGWYENGYVSATSSTGAYIAHHNAPQYFGYLANSSERNNLHGLPNFVSDIQNGNLPASGGVFYAKGGYNNILGLNQVYPGYPGVWNGDDDHPGYSDAQISEAQVATEVNAIASSKYWNQSAIVIAWDDSEGDYDHVPPPLRSIGPGSGNSPADFLTAGPRVPLMIISPYAKTHQVIHGWGSQSSIVAFVDGIFGLTPLAQLPDEVAGGQAAAAMGKSNYFPTDGPGDVDNLLDAFDLAKLSGSRAPLPPSYVLVPTSYITTLPQTSGLGCTQIGVGPVDYLRGVANQIPADFSPRPEEDAAAATGRPIRGARAQVERAKDPND